MEVHHRFLADHLVALADDKRVRRHRVLIPPFSATNAPSPDCLGGNNQLGAIAYSHPAVLKLPPGVLQIATREMSVLPKTTVVSAERSAPWSRRNPDRRWQARQWPTVAADEQRPTRRHSDGQGDCENFGGHRVQPDHDCPANRCRLALTPRYNRTVRPSRPIGSPGNSRGLRGPARGRSRCA